MIQYADNGRDGGGNNEVSANSVGVSVNVNVDVDNDQPSSSNSNVPSTSGINRVCAHAIYLKFSFFFSLKIFNICINNKKQVKCIMFALVLMMNKFY